MKDDTRPIVDETRIELDLSKFSAIKKQSQGGPAFPGIRLHLATNGSYMTFGPVAMETARATLEFGRVRFHTGTDRTVRHLVLVEPALEEDGEASALRGRSKTSSYREVTVPKELCKQLRLSPGNYEARRYWVIKNGVLVIDTTQIMRI